MQGYTPEVRNPSERIMYHLFASLGFGSNYDGPQLFDPSTYVGFLYRASPRGSDVVSGAWIIASHNNASHTHIYTKYLADRILSKTSGNLQKRKFRSLQVQITDRILEYSICGFVYIYIYRVSCNFNNRFGHAVSKIYIAVLVWCCWEYSICWFVCIYAMFYGFFVQFHIE